MIQRISILILVLFCSVWGMAQDYTFQTFKDTRVINTPSVETLAKRKLDIRIGHRFGDLVGTSGGWETFYGLESAQDIMIGGAYGVTDDFTIGLNRTKGAGPLKRLINITGKYRLLRQKQEGTPLTITFYGLSSFSTMKKDGSNPDVLNSFPKNSHRVMYTLQFLVARKFSDVFSLQLIPSYTHRNFVASNDENGLFSLGLATRIQLNKVFGIIADFTYPISDLRSTDNGYYPPMGIGLEMETGGHIFQLNFTNARGIAETDYIPNTQANWGDGQFRLGFTISRTFNL